MIAAGGTHMAMSTSSNTPPPAPKLAVTMDVTADASNRNAATGTDRLSGIRVRSKR